MGMPRWWAERRYGLFLDASLASVPAWAPIGAAAGRYRRHLGEVSRLGEVAAGGQPAPAPLVEVLAHHNDRWGHIARYDDFAELLTFDRFDAEEWAALATGAGATYTVLSAKHHDGWCWWDAASTDRTLVRYGPRRDVLAEYAAACERNGLVFGAYYELEDGGDPGSPEILSARLCDLVERYGVQMLCGAIDDRAPDRSAAAARLDARTVERLAAPANELVVDDAIAELCATDDRHRSDGPTPAEVVAFSGDPPAGIVHRPWQLCHPVGRSFGSNRAETAEHQMTSDAIVSLLTEVVAKGGNLLLGVAVTADGTVADLHRPPLIEAGSWIRAHHDVLQGGRPWSTWGDATARYWLVDDDLHAVDVTGDGVFSALRGDERRVERMVRITPDAHSVATRPGDEVPPADPASEIPFAQDAEGVRLLLQRRDPPVGGDTPAAVVYRVDLRPARRAVELFESSAAPPIELAPIVEGAIAGSIVQLGEGVYAGPAELPAGVTVRGLGADRTTITTNGGELLVGRDGRLEHLRVESETCPLRPPQRASVRVASGGATLLGCRIDGRVTVDADDTTIRASQMCELGTRDVERLLVSRSRFEGDRRRTAITISGGADHEIDSCEFSGHLCAIHVAESTGIAIAGNHIESRGWGICLVRTDRAHVHGNLIVSTMRAVDIDGGSAALVDGNAVFDGDSGCIVQGGATDCEVAGNHWERCRIGLLSWDTPEVRVHGNHAVELHEPDNELMIGP